MIKTDRRGGHLIFVLDDLYLFIMLVEVYVSGCVASDETIFHPRS